LYFFFELFDVKYYRDLEIWIKGHSSLLKMVPLEGFLFAIYSIYGRIISRF